MLAEIEIRLNTPPREGNIKSVILDMESWRKSGEHVVGYRNEPVHVQLTEWAVLRGFTVDFDFTSGRAEISRKYHSFAG